MKFWAFLRINMWGNPPKFAPQPRAGKFPGRRCRHHTWGHNVSKPGEGGGGRVGILGPGPGAPPPPPGGAQPPRQMHRLALLPTVRPIQTILAGRTIHPSPVPPAHAVASPHCTPPTRCRAPLCPCPYTRINRNSQRSPRHTCSAHSRFIVVAHAILWTSQTGAEAIPPAHVLATPHASPAYLALQGQNAVAALKLPSAGHSAPLSQAGHAHPQSGVPYTGPHRQSPELGVVSKHWPWPWQALAAPPGHSDGSRRRITQGHPVCHRHRKADRLCCRCRLRTRGSLPHACAMHTAHRTRHGRGARTCTHTVPAQPLVHTQQHGPTSNLRRAFPHTMPMSVAH